VTKRWSEAQHLVAAHLRSLYPYAVAVGSGMPGRDVTGTPGAAFEVKARKSFDPGAWMRQAARQAGEGELSITVIRPNGGGPTNVGSWPCLITLDELITMLGAIPVHEEEK
jgi:hypothetical protein